MAIDFKKNTNKEQETPSASLSEKINTLPEPLKKRFFAFVLGSILVILITLALVIWFREIRFFVGLLIAFYIAFLGIDIVWAYHNGTLICQRMCCIKATKHIVFIDCLEVICQELNSQKALEDRVHRFYVSASKKNRVYFTEGTVLDIYYKPNSPADITAWTVLGFLETN